ncbi:MAG: GtrA family protein [Nanopusillaceae archaeon]
MVFDINPSIIAFPSRLVYKLTKTDLTIIIEIIILALKENFTIINIPTSFQQKSYISKQIDLFNFMKIILYMVKNSIATFLLVGLTALIFTQILLIFLLILNIPRLTSLIIANETSIWFGFSLNDMFYSSFKNKWNYKFVSKGVRYNIIYAITELVTSFLAFLLNKYIGIHIVWANVIMSILVAPLNYFLNIVYTWKW